MSTVPCPGCGMPRAAELIDRAPCPICGEATAEPLALEPESPPTPLHARAGDLPADAADLEHWTAAKKSRFGTGLALGFAFGTAVGIGGAVAWQRGFALPAFGMDDNPATAQAEPVTPPPEPPAAPPAPIAPPTVKPQPEAPNPPPMANPAVSSPPPVLQPPPPPGQLVVIEVNEPNGTYSLPFATLNREQIVLKGRAKVLRLGPVRGGASIDASALIAGEIRTDAIDGGARVKLNAPEGVVTIGGKLDGLAVLEINAPGGEVTFPAAMPERPMIDGGAKLAATAKRVAIRGDVKGAATHVRITLTRAGTLHVGAVQGTAIVEYRNATSGWSYSTVTIGPVAPSATVRELGPKPDAVTDDN